MANADGTLTHKDLAKALGVSETTIKSYRRKFPRFFPLHSRGKPLHFKAEALDVCQRIRQGFARDLSVEEVRSVLAQEFSHLQQNDNRPVRDSSALDSPPAPVEHQRAFQSMAASLEQLLVAQQHANARLDALQELMADFLSLHLGREDAFSQGMQELKRTWNRHFQRLSQRESRQAEEPTPQVAAPGPKRVLVRNAYGQSNEYLIETRGGQQSAQSQDRGGVGASVESPPDSLLELPLVVRTGAGEYLGVAGKSEGAFSLHDFLSLMDGAYTPPHHFSREWRLVDAGDGRWRLHLEQEDAIRPLLYALDVESASTPRGNEVALLSRFESQGAEMPPANVYGLIRQMKQQT